MMSCISKKFTLLGPVIDGCAGRPLVAAEADCPGVNRDTGTSHRAISEGIK